MSPRRPVPQKKKESGLPSWVPVAAVAVIVIVGLAIALDFISKVNTTPAVPTSVSTEGIIRAGRTEGDPNAPVTLMEFSDFQ